MPGLWILSVEVDAGGLLAVFLVWPAGCSREDLSGAARDRSQVTVPSGLQESHDDPNLGAGVAGLRETSALPNDAVIPLPPGWAAELAELREQQASVRKQPQVSLADLIAESPDGLVPPQPRSGDQNDDRFWGAHLPNSRGGSAPPSNRGHWRGPIAPRSSIADYTVMALVFAVPLIVILLTLWVRQVLSAFRSGPGHRVAPLRSRRAS